MIAENKRGQAAGAAVLITVIAGLLIMFIILIPPQDRADLLGEDTPGSHSSTDEIEDALIEENLLIENPGRIDYLAQKELEHPLPVVNIYTKTESKVLAEKNVANTKEAVFTNEVANFNFNVPSLENSESFLLSFNINAAKGNLIISLNGEDIFNSPILEGNVQPIKLPKNLLKDVNELIFSSSSPGLAFWATNEANLDQIKIVADVTSVEAQSSKNIFLVSETEKKNIEKVILKFQPNCNQEDVGKLIISINGNEIYNALPECDLKMVPIEFSADLVYQGENEVIFSTNKGTYLLSHILIKSDLKELDFPTYYFELSQEQYESVKDNNLRVRLEMNFVDLIVNKEGEVIFNGHSDHFDTKEISYVADLSDDIVKGNNAIKIQPKKTLDVREIKVDLVE
jgi:hypothetical protein